MSRKEISTEFLNLAHTRPATLAAVGDGNIDQAVNVIKSWRNERPEFTAVVDAIVGMFGFSPYHRGMIMAAADLAAEPRTLFYHDNQHSLERFFIASILGMQAIKEAREPLEKIAIMMTSALVLDYGHDGSTNWNPKREVNDQLKMQSRAVERVTSALFGDYGISWHDWNAVEALVYATDDSIDPERFKREPLLARSVATGLKMYLFREEGEKPDEHVLHYKIRHILHDDQYAECAQMLQDADAGKDLLDVGFAKRAAKNFAKEQRDLTGYNTNMEVFERLGLGRMFSISGKALMGDRIEQTMNTLSHTPKLKVAHAKAQPST